MLAGLGRLLYWACMAVAVTLIALAVSHRLGVII